MATVKEQILGALAGNAGMTDREITNVIKGRSEDQQGVNQACRQLAAVGVLERRKRQDHLIGNYPTGTAVPKPRTSSTGVRQSRSGMAGEAMLSEDEVKTALKAWLEDQRWTVEIAWARARGIDIDAVRGDERWIIEVKGCGSLSAMRVNYFLGVLGETLQRMDDPTARYSIAFPDIKQFRGLWERLPELAKERLGLSVLFVTTDGRVSFECMTTAVTDGTGK